MILALLIPAFQPQPALLTVLQNVAQSGRFTALIVVNDGSDSSCDGIFAGAARISGAVILKHPENLGKGAALKTGFTYALRHYPNLAGVVTADADGQHLPGDIVKVADHFTQNPGDLVLGARNFSGDVPLRSRFGNLLTRAIVRVLVGPRLTDTQTGLRAIPAALLPELLKISATGYDFELDMLITAKRHHFAVVEEPITTVYEPGNASSHFNPLLDSIKIYFVLLRFSSVSLITSTLDGIVFYLAWTQTHNALASLITGRAVAVIFNYIAVRRAVFHTRQAHQTALPRYLLLVLCSGTVAYFSIRAIMATLPVPVMAAKIVVESLIFFANFTVQRNFIFSGTKTRR